MKHYLFLSAFILAAAAATAQHLDFVEEGRTWTTASLDYADGQFGDGFYKNRAGLWCYAMTMRCCYLEGDTLIENRQYKKAYYKDSEKPFAAVRQEDKRVYLYENDQEKESLLYDFGLKEGDTFETAMFTNTKLRVHSTDTIEFNGLRRKVLTMYAAITYPTNGQIIGEEIFADYWIEGIGGTGNTFFPFWWEIIGQEPLLTSCVQDDIVLFNYDDYNRLSTSIRSHRIYPTVFHQQELFDLTGRSISNEPRKGIYIRGGKKFIIR